MCRMSAHLGGVYFCETCEKALAAEIRMRYKEFVPGACENSEDGASRGSDRRGSPEYHGRYRTGQLPPSSRLGRCPRNASSPGSGRWTLKGDLRLSGGLVTPPTSSVVQDAGCDSLVALGEPQEQMRENQVRLWENTIE